MSKFFDQYASILEKNLQKVRLKVDPLNKYAEDFAQYHGYEGYILAETKDAIKFYTNNQIVMIPKKAVVVENWKQGVTNFLQGAAGQQPVGATGALGSIARGVAGTAARAVFGPGVTGTGNNAAAQPTNAAPVNRSNITPVGPDLATGLTIPVKDKAGTALIVDSKGNEYYVLKIVLASNPNKILESKSFNDLLYKHAALVQEIAVNNPPGNPPGNPPPTKTGIRYVDIISKPEFRNESAYLTVMNVKTGALLGGYGFVIGIPNAPNTVAVAFSKQP
jgi:RNase P/RNase MRP subunit p29